LESPAAAAAAAFAAPLPVLSSLNGSIIVSGSRRTSVRVCAREFWCGAAERRARGTFQSPSQACTSSTHNCVLWRVCACEY
jgi:hypothetical protein